MAKSHPDKQSRENPAVLNRQMIVSVLRNFLTEWLQLEIPAVSDNFLTEEMVDAEIKVLGGEYVERMSLVLFSVPVPWASWSAEWNKARKIQAHKNAQSKLAERKKEAGWGELREWFGKNWNPRPESGIRFHVGMLEKCKDTLGPDYSDEGVKELMRAWAAPRRKKDQQAA